MAIGLLIVEEMPIIRLGLRHLSDLDSKLRVIADVPDGASAIHIASGCRPDLVILGERLLGRNGLALVSQLRSIHPAIPIAIITKGLSSAQVGERLAAGITGIIHYDESPEQMVEAIRAIAAGKIFLSWNVVDETGAGSAKQMRSDEDPPQMGLTAREVDVLGLLVTGMTNKQVAASFSLSVRTVESHRARMMAKLGLRSAAQLAHFALSHGISPAPAFARMNEDHLSARAVDLDTRA